LTIFGLVVTVTVDLLTASSNQFIFALNCTYVINLLIFSQAVLRRCMQRGVGNRKAVCPSVKRVHVTKRKHLAKKFPLDLETLW